MSLRVLPTLFALLLATPPAFADIRDDAPPRGDPFTNILDASKLKTANVVTIEGIANKRVAVILSDNTEKHLKWSDGMTGGRSGADRVFGQLFGGSDRMAESDRIYRETYSAASVVNSVVEPLVRKAKEVKVIEDVQDFVSGGFDLLVLMDVTFVNTFNDGFIVGTKYESGMYVKAFFIDRASTLLSAVEVGETRAVPRNRFVYVAADIRKEMVGRYQTGIDRLLGPDRGAKPAAVPVAAPAPAVAAAPARPAAERLRELDELVKQGLVTPEEAAVRRKAILDGI